MSNSEVRMQNISYILTSYLAHRRYTRVPDGLPHWHWHWPRADFYAAAKLERVIKRGRPH
jgi:hypothetical protein